MYLQAKPVTLGSEHSWERRAGRKLVENARDIFRYSESSFVISACCTDPYKDSVLDIASSESKTVHRSFEPYEKMTRFKTP
jgi:hypothetical protein